MPPSVTVGGSQLSDLPGILTFISWRVNSTLVKSQVAEKKNGKRMQKSYYMQMNERQNGSRDRYIDLKKKAL